MVSPSILCLFLCCHFSTCSFNYSCFSHFHLFSCLFVSVGANRFSKKDRFRMRQYSERTRRQKGKKNTHTHEKSSTKCVSVHVWSQQGARLVASWCPQICSRPHFIRLNLHHTVQPPIKSDSEILNSGMNKPERGMGTFFKNLHNMTEKCVNSAARGRLKRTKPDSYGSAAEIHKDAF